MKNGLLGKYLLPDYYFRDYSEVTPEFLHSIGMRAVIADIDNTLVTYDDPAPTVDVLKWLDALRSAEIQVAFVSNNNRERVERFCKGLDYFYSYNSGKPSVKAYKRAAQTLGAALGECAVIGDQIFTDIIAAKRLGMKGIIVKPIKDKLTPLFKLKRAGERLIYKIYKIKF